MNQDEQSVQQIKQCYEDGEITVNGNTYVLTKFTHSERLVVASCLQVVAEKQLAALVLPEVKTAQKIIENNVLVGGMQLSKLPTHWDENLADILPFWFTVFQVVAYPLLEGLAGSSQSQRQEAKTTLSPRT